MPRQHDTSDHGIPYLHGPFPAFPAYNREAAELMTSRVLEFLEKVGRPLVTTMARPDH